MNRDSFQQLKNLIGHLPKSKVLAGKSVPDGKYKFYLSGKKLGRINESISNKTAVIMGDGCCKYLSAKGEYCYFT